MTGENKNLCTQTVVVSVPDPGFGAIALRKNDVPTIVVSAGTVAIINEISIVSAMGYVYNKQACSGLFMGQLADAFRANMENLESGKDLVGYLTPFEFVKTEKEYCPQLTEEYFRNNFQLDNLKEAYLASSLRFVLAHELAHHINGDTRTIPTSAKDSRRKEMQADIVGLKLLSDSDGNPVESVIVLFILAAFDDFAMDAKVDDTHPVGRERLGVFADALEETLKQEEFRNELRREGQLEKWLQMVSTVRKLREGNE